MGQCNCLANWLILVAILNCHNNVMGFWFSMEPQSDLEDEIDHNLAICQGSSMFLNCRNRYNKIVIKDTFYGRKNNHTCASKMFDTEQLCDKPSPSYIREKIDTMCTGEYKCKVPVTPGFIEKKGTQMCPLSRKYLQITYACHQDPKLHMVCYNNCTSKCWPLCERDCCVPKVVESKLSPVKNASIDQEFTESPQELTCHGSCPNRCAPQCDVTCCQTNPIKPAKEEIPKESEKTQNEIKEETPKDSKKTQNEIKEAIPKDSKKTRNEIKSCPGDCLNICAPLCRSTCCNRHRTSTTAKVEKKVQKKTKEKLNYYQFPQIASAKRKPVISNNDNRNPFYGQQASAAMQTSCPTVCTERCAPHCPLECCYSPGEPNVPAYQVPLSNNPQLASKQAMSAYYGASPQSMLQQQMLQYVPGVTPQTYAQSMEILSGKPQDQLGYAAPAAANNGYQPLVQGQTLDVEIPSMQYTRDNPAQTYKQVYPVQEQMINPRLGGPPGSPLGCPQTCVRSCDSSCALNCCAPGSFMFTTPSISDDEQRRSYEKILAEYRNKQLEKHYQRNSVVGG